MTGDEKGHGEARPRPVPLPGPYRPNPPRAPLASPKPVGDEAGFGPSASADQSKLNHRQRPTPLTVRIGLTAKSASVSPPQPPPGQVRAVAPQDGPRPTPLTPPSAHLSLVEETSAGGVAVRPPAHGEKGPQAAVIVRRNRAGRIEWCLPKGRLEPGETPQEAAAREVREETGIDGEIRGTLGLIDYWFTGGARRVHKVVHHYLLTMIGGYLTVENDPDQEAEDAFWVPVAELPERLSYPNEQRIAVAARQTLARNPELIIPTSEAGSQ